MKNADLTNLIYYFQMAVTVIVAGIGLIVTHHFTSRRDRKNSERLMRLEALRRAYLSFVKLGILGSYTKRDLSGKMIPIGDEIQEAISLLYLFGDEEISLLTSRYVEDLSSNENADATCLVNALREAIRSEINLPPLSTVPRYLRLELTDHLASGKASDADKARVLDWLVANQQVKEKSGL